MGKDGACGNDQREFAEPNQRIVIVDGFNEVGHDTSAVIKSFLNYLDDNPDKANVFLNELEKNRKTDEESLF